MPSRTPPRSHEPSSTLPLFPLPHLLTYPGRLLPLHIFEARYRALMRDVLDGDRRFAMAVLRPGWEPEYEGRPPIYAPVTVGRVSKYRELPDGRFVLHLRGESRARVLEESGGRPYRIGRLELIAEEPLDSTKAAELRPEIEGVLRDYCGKVALPPKPECDGDAEPPAICPVLIADEALLSIPIPMERKLEIFSTPCQATRVRAVIEVLRGLLNRRIEISRCERLTPRNLSMN